MNEHPVSPVPIDVVPVASDVPFVVPDVVFDVVPDVDVELEAVVVVVAEVEEVVSTGTRQLGTSRDSPRSVRIPLHGDGMLPSVHPRRFRGGTPHRPSRGPLNGSRGYRRSLGRLTVAS